MNKYAVIRTDLMSGTKQPADMVSLRFYDSLGNPAEVENGVIAKLQGFESGEREVYKAVAATDSDDLSECVVIASPEVMYDERKRNLDEYINEAGKILRGYILRRGNIFSLSAEGFGTVPAKGDNVVIGSDGKLTKGASGATGVLGTCADVENTGRYTYYAVRIGKTEA